VPPGRGPALVGAADGAWVVDVDCAAGTGDAQAAASAAAPPAMSSANALRLVTSVMV